MSRFLPRVTRLSDGLTLAGALSALRGERGLVALDSAGGWPARDSLLGFDPVTELRFEERSALDSIQAALDDFIREAGDEIPGPFHGGFLGALAYDIGVAGEHQNLPRDPRDTPLVVGGIYCDFIVFAHEARAAWLVLGDDPGDGRASVEERRGHVLAKLAGEAGKAGHKSGAGAAPGHKSAMLAFEPTSALVRQVSSLEHQARIERTQAAIGRGDLYQANLAHRFTRTGRGSSVDLYLRLRELNEAPYMGFLRWNDDRGAERAILSGSPELLFAWDGELARTRPIKGTAPRHADPERDARARAGLLESEKDRAELAMIVDLARNDLGRIAAPGGVEVMEFPVCKSYARVHHLMCDVVARLQADRGAFDLLRALFPGASITGAPKLAAMEAIAREEGEGRGFFTGSLGFVDTRGQAAFNILIRTLFARCKGEDMCVDYHVGGGITFASDPEAEDRETLDKGLSLAAALEASRP